MSTLLHYVRRALELPPRETAARAVELAADRWSARRQRIAARLAPDPLDEAVMLRRLGANRDAVPTGFFRDGAVLPLAWTDAARDTPAPRAAASAAIDHCFDLLGSGPVRVSLAALGADMAERQRRAMHALLPGCAEGYDPIDWHVDFRSGYRWDAQCWFADVAFGQHPGVDVKVPWELSRFQHTGALGLVWRIDPTSAEGRRAPPEFVAQVVDWIAANPVGHGVNWACAMDVGLRAVSWLNGVALMQDAPELDARFRWLLARSLYAHASHIERNLEYQRTHTGNHYLSDVVALLGIGAALPEFAESSRWCLYGMQELASELERQVLPDGADIEGSAAYHHLVAELFFLGTLVATRLDPSRRARLAAARPGRVPHHSAPALRPLDGQSFSLDRPELFDAAHFASLYRMAAFAAAMIKPDGRIPQTGDNDNGRAWLLTGAADPVPDARDRCTLLALAGHLFDDPAMTALAAPYAADAALLSVGAPLDHIRAAARRGANGNPVIVRAGTDENGVLRVFPDGGLAVLRRQDLYVAVTFARVPHNGSGGHFHNDLLSFELQLDGLDFIVDGGSFQYTGAPALRDAFRSTAAHSTVVVQGREQRMWPAGPGRLFGVHEDASVDVLYVTEAALSLRAAYADVRHVRTFAWGGAALVIEDAVTAPVPAYWCISLHPDATVAAMTAAADAHVIRLERDGRALVINLRGVDTPVVAEGWYSSGYGTRVPSSRLVAPIRGDTVTATLEFTGARGQNRPPRRVSHASESTR